MSIPFDPKEMEVTGYAPAFGPPGTPPLPVYNYPTTAREAFIATLERRPIWQMTDIEGGMFNPMVHPDNIARSFVVEARPFDPNTGGGKDMFGIEWEYVPSAGGSMVRPGSPFLEDANEWYDKLVWPDVDSWDWEGCAEANRGFLNKDKFNTVWQLNGWFERLISFMDFENAILAMIDEDQEDAIKELFDRLTDLYIKIFDKYIEYFPEISCFCVHDDWGAQKDTFFSPATAEKMIVPAMRRLTDYLHSRGKYCEMHSCGQLFKQVPNMIKAGWDFWSGQVINDSYGIYDLYGDRIIIGVNPQYDPEAPEEEQRAAAREFAEHFCRPDKPSIICSPGAVLTPVFREELYRQSRINYSK